MLSVVLAQAAKSPMLMMQTRQLKTYCGNWWRCGNSLLRAFVWSDTSYLKKTGWYLLICDAKVLFCWYRAVVQEVESISLDCFKIVRVAHGQYLDSPPREGRDKIPELQRILVNRVAIDCGNDASFPLHRSILFRLIYKIIFRSLDDADDPLRSMLWNEVLRKCERSIWLVKGLFAGR